MDFETIVSNASDYLQCTDNSLRHEIFVAAIGALCGFLCMKAARLLAISLAVGIIVLQLLQQYGHLQLDWCSLLNEAADYAGKMFQWASGERIPLLAQRGFLGGLFVGASLS